MYHCIQGCRVFVRVGSFPSDPMDLSGAIFFPRTLFLRIKPNTSTSVYLQTNDLL